MSESPKISPRSRIAQAGHFIDRESGAIVPLVRVMQGINAPIDISPSEIW